MNKKYILVPVVFFVLVTLFVMWQKTSSRNPEAITVQHGLPWQIELAGGESRVFNLTPGKSQLADAVRQIGSDYELAILSKSGQPDVLELFTSNFQAGLLKGSLILVADVSSEDIERLRMQFPVRQEHLETGIKKMILRFEQQQAALSYTIKSITFVPVAQLDKQLIEQRFGSPGRTSVIENTVTSYLYPQFGLNIIIDEKGKDFLVYVSPKSFSSLQAPVQGNTRN